MQNYVFFVCMPPFNLIIFLVVKKSDLQNRKILIFSCIYENR